MMRSKSGPSRPTSSDSQARYVSAARMSVRPIRTPFAESCSDRPVRDSATWTGSRISDGNVKVQRTGARSETRRPTSDSCRSRSEEHTSELQSPDHLVCRLLLEKKKYKSNTYVY